MSGEHRERLAGGGGTGGSSAGASSGAASSVGAAAGVGVDGAGVKEGSAVVAGAGVAGGAVVDGAGAVRPSRSAGAFVARFALALAAICLGVVTAVSALSTVWLMTDAKTGNLTQSMSVYTVASPASWAVLAAGAVLVLALCALAWRRGGLLDGPAASWALVAATLVAQLALILVLQTRDGTWGDFWMVSAMVDRAWKEGVQAVFEGPYKTLFYDARLYFACYPFQASYFWLMLGLRYAFGEYSYMALQAVSALGNALAVASVLSLGRSITRSAGARRVLWVLTALMLPMYWLCTFLYLNALGCGLALAFLAMQARAMRARGLRARLLWCAGSLVPLALALCVKATFVLFAIGALLAWAVLAICGEAAPGADASAAAAPGALFEPGACEGVSGGDASGRAVGSGSSSAPPPTPAQAPAPALSPTPAQAPAPGSADLRRECAMPSPDAARKRAPRRSARASRPPAAKARARRLSALAGLAASVAVVMAARGIANLPFEAMRAASGGYEFGEALTTLNHLELGLRMGQGEFYVSIDGGEYGFAPGGWSNHANALWESSGENASVQNAVASQLLAQHAVEFATDPAYALWFFATKLATEWADPTYQSLYYLAECEDAAGERVCNPADLDTPLGLACTVLTFVLDGYQTVCLAAALGCVLWARRRWGSDVAPEDLLARHPEQDAEGSPPRHSERSAEGLPPCHSERSAEGAKSKNPRSVPSFTASGGVSAAKGPMLLLALTFFTGFGCYLLWEAKSVYVLPFAIVALPLSAFGLDLAFRRLRALRLRIAGRPLD